MEPEMEANMVPAPLIEVEASTESVQRTKCLKDLQSFVKARGGSIKVVSLTPLFFDIDPDYRSIIF